MQEVFLFVIKNAPESAVNFQFIKEEPIVADFAFNKRNDSPCYTPNQRGTNAMNASCFADEKSLLVLRTHEYTVYNVVRLSGIS